MWTILNTGKSSAQENMVLDVSLLENMALKEAKPTLHLYDWECDSLTYGYFIDPAAFLSKEALSLKGIQIARRPTGGGIIFHHTDFAFSILIPATHPHFSINTLENYAFVNNLIIELISNFMGGKASLSLLPDEVFNSDSHSRHFCMAKPTKYDVMLEGKKIGGGAQRRTRFGFLHQGSISLVPPDNLLLSQILLPNTSVLEEMNRHTSHLLEKTANRHHINEARLKLSRLFSKSLK